MLVNIIIVSGDFSGCVCKSHAIYELESQTSLQIKCQIANKYNLRLVRTNILSPIGLVEQKKNLRKTLMELKDLNGLCCSSDCIYRP